MQRVIYVLHLAAFPPGVDFRPWGVEIDGFTLLRWLLLRIARRVPASSVVVLTHSRGDRVLASGCAAGTGVAVLQSRADSKLEAIADIAAAFPAHEVAWFGPEFAFAPSDLLERIVLHHGSAGSHYTRTASLPDAIGCEIANAALLVAIGSVAYGGDAPDLFSALTELTRMRSDAPAAEQIRAVPFNIAEQYDRVIDFPKIAVMTRHDADRARRCLVDLPDDYNFAPVEKWLSERVPAYLPPFSNGTPQSGGLGILYISTWAGYSGAEECLVALARGISRLGFRQSALVAMEGLLAKRLRDLGVSVACPNWEVTANSEEADALAACVLDTVKPDVIHCNTPPGPAFLRHARLRGIPVVGHIRVAAGLEQWNDLIAGSARVVAVSQLVRHRIEALGGTAERIRVVYDGVDPDRFRPGVHGKTAVRARLGIPQDAFVVLLIARLDIAKRHDLLIEAAARAIKSAGSLMLVFVGTYGDPVLRRRLAEHAAARGIADRILWLPFQEDVRDVEIAADVLVQCSDFEAFGTSVLEAMSLEKPVIVSDASGIREAVEHGSSGIIVPAGNPDALAAALVRIARQPDWAKMLGNHARLRILDRFTVDHHARMISEIFLDVAGPGETGSQRLTCTQPG